MTLQEAFKHLEQMSFGQRIQWAIDDLTDVISDCQDDEYTHPIQDIKDVIHGLEVMLEINEAIKNSVAPAPTAG